MASIVIPDNPSGPPNTFVTEDEIIGMMRSYFETLFPKECSSCGKTYSNFREYLRATTPVGDAISYDAEFGDMEPDQPIGLLAYANCDCGNTMALTTRNRKLADVHFALKWIRSESERRGLGVQELINLFRRKMRQQEMDGMDC